MNNAGIGVFGPLELIPIEQFRRQLEVNVTGQLAVTQVVLRTAFSVYASDGRASADRTIGHLRR